MKLPPLSAIKAFEATARHLSFSRAAEELFVTHAAVSHQIKNLEEWFGTKLFLREGRGIRLSRSGESLYRKVSPALFDIADACRTVKMLVNKESLTVGCIPSIANRWLVPNLNTFTSSHPDLDVKIVYATVDDTLEDNELDVLITTGQEKGHHVVSRWLFSRANKPVCSKAFLQSQGQLDTPEQMLTAPLIHDENRKGWQEWFEAAGVPWKATDSWPLYQDFNLLATAVIAGHGIALCPVEVFRLEIERGDLIVLSDISTKNDMGYYASYRENTTDVAVHFVGWFAQFVADH
ncbi:LysR substrate-binding domain-containing protein [Enterovibrio baiacu]|uniref:LysR substrate-binding domain-containing protein n=1 Tax=Enterovibrio baiacu TaxID=2491023 RepID=UPI001010AFCA|nr:LysR substrate-binding domain-containing protein [Enterovibrio baiacu]MBE1275888.1 LysR family transcriptional regulator [Enterovibrio baiacu]